MTSTFRSDSPAEAFKDSLVLVATTGLGFQARSLSDHLAIYGGWGKRKGQRALSASHLSHRRLSAALQWSSRVAELVDQQLPPQLSFFPHSSATAPSFVFLFRSRPAGRFVARHLFSELLEPILNFEHFTECFIESR
jgi:hypothetical protein